jgi:hypothetical protein
MAATAHAWGEAGHLISNEAATLGLPHDMPVFFYRAFPRLVWLGPEPDRIKGAGVSIEAFNFPNHFLDYEFVAPLDLPPDRYQYMALMESSGRTRFLHITNSEAGFLPWQIAELSDELTVQFRLWRNAMPGSSEQRALEDEIISTAGNLGHFVADAANPHHATINFNGWVEPNPEGFATDCHVHDRFERDFVSQAMTTAEVVPLLSAPAMRTDYFQTALSCIRQSNSEVVTLYRLDKRGAFDTMHGISPEGRTFAAARLAAGASLIRDIWWSAWRNSARKAVGSQIAAN